LYLIQFYWNFVFDKGLMWWGWVEINANTTTTMTTTVVITVMERNSAWLLKGAMSQFAHLEKFSLHFSSLSFVIRVNLLHPWPSLCLYGLLLSLWCFFFSILINYYFQVSLDLKSILFVAKITQNTVTEFLWLGGKGEICLSMSLTD